MAISRERMQQRAGSYATEEVHVPEWAEDSGDDVVVVRGMTIREYELTQQTADKGKATATLVCKCTLEPALSVKDVDWVAELGLAPVLRLDKVISRLSGLGVDDEDAKAVAAAVEGNSEATPVADSSSV